MHGVQQLTFIFVHPFDLDVEQGVRIYNDMFARLNEICQSLLVSLLYFEKLPLESLVLCLNLQPPDRAKVADPTVSNGSLDQFPKVRIAARQPASMGDSVRFVVK